MNEAIKRRWVEALRGTDYEQGPGNLRRDDEDGTPTFCCLGVLCDLAVRDGVIPPPEPAKGGQYIYDEDSDSFLPSRVAQWAGLDRTTDPYIESANDSLATLNDEGHNFDVIAEYIEEEL